MRKKMAEGRECDGAICVSIKVMRYKSLMSQTTLAKEFDVPPTTINRWETGKVKPNLAAMKAIKTFCG